MTGTCESDRGCFHFLTGRIVHGNDLRDPVLRAGPAVAGGDGPDGEAGRTGEGRRRANQRRTATARVALPTPRQPEWSGRGGPERRPGRALSSARQRAGTTCLGSAQRRPPPGSPDPGPPRAPITRSPGRRSGPNAGVGRPQPLVGVCCEPKYTYQRRTSRRCAIGAWRERHTRWRKFPARRFPAATSPEFSAPADCLATAAQGEISAR